MRIESPLPTHVARAYDVSLTRTVATAQPVQASPGIAAAQPVEHAAPSGPLARIERTAIPGKVNQLIGGAVPGMVRFDGSFTPLPSQSASLQLYTRAADRIEAATGIQLGRTIDLSG